jgi:hypothetical protein
VSGCNLRDLYTLIKVVQVAGVLYDYDRLTPAGT